MLVHRMSIPEEVLTFLATASWIAVCENMPMDEKMFTAAWNRIEDASNQVNSGKKHMKIMMNGIKNFYDARRITYILNNKSLNESLPYKPKWFRAADIKKWVAVSSPHDSMHFKEFGFGVFCTNLDNINLAFVKGMLILSINAFTKDLKIKQVDTVSVYICYCREHIHNVTPQNAQTVVFLLKLFHMIYPAVKLVPDVVELESRLESTATDAIFTEAA